MRQGDGAARWAGCAARGGLTDLHRLDGLEDELEGDEVGQVADDGASGGERPRALVKEPREHLNEAKRHAEAEARVDEEGELGLAAAAEEVDEHLLLAHEAVDHQLVEVDHLARLRLHVLDNVGHVTKAKRLELSLCVDGQTAQRRLRRAEPKAARLSGDHLADDLLGDAVDSGR